MAKESPETHLSRLPAELRLLLISFILWLGANGLELTDQENSPDSTQDELQVLLAALENDFTTESVDGMETPRFFLLISQLDTQEHQILVGTSIISSKNTITPKSIASVLISNPDNISTKTAATDTAGAMSSHDFISWYQKNFTAETGWMPVLRIYFGYYRGSFFCLTKVIAVSPETTVKTITETNSLLAYRRDLISTPDGQERYLIDVCEQNGG